MSITERIPSLLQQLTEGKKEIQVESGTVGKIISELNKHYPGTKERLLDENEELRRFVNIYVDEEDVRFLDGLATKVPDNSEVSIIPAVAGG